MAEQKKEPSKKERQRARGPRHPSDQLDGAVDARQHNGGHGNGGSAGGPNEPPFRVSLFKPEHILAEDHALWAAIRNRADAISFNNYTEFIDQVLCVDGSVGTPTCVDEDSQLDPPKADEIGAPSIRERALDLTTVPTIHGVDAYNLLKLATQAFLLFEAGVAINLPRYPAPDADPPTIFDVVPGEEARTGVAFSYDELQDRLENYLRQTLGGSSGSASSLRYLKRITSALLATDDPEQGLPYCVEVMRSRFTCPSLLELIWSYWQEEGMLVQTMNAICMRFQNRRGPLERDPLANLEIDPLRPLNNLLWGYIQDEYNRLTVPRRAYEYDHHYGLKIMGKAVPDIRSADSRSKFIEGFHNLLYRTSVFYRADSDTTVIADGFPLLNSLREVHILLAEGAHNQFGDLPWTSRVEMLMAQWMLSRTEMREFLRGRAMVPYQEPWMGQVDTMNKLQGWNDASITHFRNLSVFGEQILLSVRYGDWMGINDQDSAKTWARYWRSEIQAYIHAYLAVTGVDLSEDTTSARTLRARYAQPSILLRDRALSKPSQTELAARSGSELPAGGVSFGALPSSSRRRLNPARKD